MVLAKAIFVVIELKGVVSVFKSDPRKYKIHTTRSWEFVGLKEEEGEDYRSDGDAPRHKYDVSDRFRVGRKFLKNAKHGDGVIVGVIDSGKFSKNFIVHTLCL